MTGEEAKKEIIDMANTLQLIPNTPKGKAVSMALKALEQTSWIPVLERSPEKSGKYLAYIINKNDDKLQYIMTCEYLVGDCYWHWFPDDECASDNVIAWMPLPEPYKPQESEDKDADSN